MNHSNAKVSVVTPTLHRPDEVGRLLDNLARQELLPDEVIIVDGAAPDNIATEQIVNEKRAQLPFKLVYLRHAKGTAIQRNAGIEVATGDFIAFIDDDIEPLP